ncbi:MAG: ATPases of the AAA+ class [Pseudolabrys sp.]|jgi:hypothetical protein|nr:ATPases of the AAA+ class [Pseudolabrys sp.]
MPAKKGTLVPKKGTVVHQPNRGHDSDVDYAIAIAAALRRELGTTHQAVKSAMRWTGASERTVKYWFAGSRGPSGHHLIALAGSSDAIFELFLQRAGRQHYAGARRLIDAHEKLKGIVEVVQSIIDDSTDR